MINKNKAHTGAMIAISLTTIFWGVGFVMSDIMLANGMPSSLINMIRFCIAAILLAIIFHKQIKLDKPTLIIGAVCGLLLFMAFELQLSALQHTTAAQNGFFTASYVVFVPFMVWIARKKRPLPIVWVGIAVALIGFVILNFAGDHSQDILVAKENHWLGNMMTIACAVIFALQITISDWALHEKHLQPMSFTFVQIAVAAILFVLYFLIFAMPSVQWTAISWNNTWYAILFAALLCTTFAYPAQINAQKALPAATVSLIMALEAVIGALASVLVGFDALSWNLIVGGILVTLAIIIVEYLPVKIAIYKARKLGIDITQINIE